MTTDYSFKGDESKFACTYDNLPTSVKPGSMILIADGSLVLKVKSCKKTSVVCNVENSQSIGERKVCAPPDALPRVADTAARRVVAHLEPALRPLPSPSQTCQRLPRRGPQCGLVSVAG